jgi:hypothetical protein
MSFSTNKAQGIIKGGSAGQILIKASNADYDTTWGAGGGGGGLVNSVFGRINAVVATLGDYTSLQVTEGITNLYFTNARAQAALSVSAPLVYSSGNITITQATTSTNGYLSATDWSTFNSKGSGTVTNIAMTVPAFLAVTGTPITTGSGTFAITSATGLAANSVLATPDSTTGAVSVRSLVENDIPNISAAKITTGVLSPAVGGAPMGFFGDGSDGALNISSGTTVLQRDQFYSSLTISGSARLDPNGFKIFVSGTLDLTNAPTNAISLTVNNGGNASGSTGGTAGTSLASATMGGTNGTASAGTNGGTGTGTSATAVTASTACLGGSNGVSGSGGGNATQVAGRTAVTRTQNSFYRIDHQILRGATLFVGGISSAGGTSGTGTTGNTSGAGGGGGAGSGVICIFANTISRGASTAASSIAAIGGAGGNGSSSTAATNAGGGGGGGGSGGGCVILFYENLTGSTATNCIDVSGGAGGNGGNGVVYRGGGGGQGGSAGRVLLFNVASGTIAETDTTNTAGSTPTVPSSTTGTSGTAGAVSRVNL